MNHLPGIGDLAMAIAENSVQGIVVMDEAGHCLYANRAWQELTGFTAATMAGGPVHDWVHHHHPDGTPFPIGQCPIGCTLGKNESVRNHRDIFFRRDGTRFAVACAASPVVAAGRPTLKILEIRDVSDEVEAERRKDEFLAMLAHELRNPLAPIAAAAALLGNEHLTVDGRRHASGVVKRQVGHMAGLIDDLLDVSRVTRGTIALRRDIVDIGTVIAEAVEQVTPLVVAGAHRLAIDPGAAPVAVEGDVKRLVQVFANVLNNAAKYTPKQGDISVTVAAAVDDASVTITVRDNGIGMTAEMAGQAFELFSQAERTPDRREGGLGIGLALVSRLVALHEGSVSLRSPGPGQGTTVAITLPLAQAAGSSRHPSAS